MDRNTKISTNATEAFYISKDLMKLFSILGARVVFSTHLHELAKDVDEMNGEAEGKSRILGMVSQVIEAYDDVEKKTKVKRTYKILPDTTNLSSYARSIAEDYGISYDQLKKELESMGKLK